MNAAMRWAWGNCGELIDPHTACGLHAALEADTDAATPVVTLATAHPAKFAGPVEAATGQHPALPERLGDLFAREERCAELPGDYAMVAEYVADHAVQRS